MSSTNDVLSLSSYSPKQVNSAAAATRAAKVIDLAGGAKDDAVTVDLSEVYKGLTVLGQKVVSKLDEILAESGAGPVSSLDPSEHTPEKTAERIVTGVTSLIEAYARQNPDLQDEELLDSFMVEVRKGIKQGYEEAVGILEAIGAFEIDGVKAGIEETMRLVEEKLLAFEENFRASSEAKEEETAPGKNGASTEPDGPTRAEFKVAA